MATAHWIRLLQSDFSLFSFLLSCSLPEQRSLLWVLQITKLTDLWSKDEWVQNPSNISSVMLRDYWSWTLLVRRLWLFGYPLLQPLLHLVLHHSLGFLDHIQSRSVFSLQQSSFFFLVKLLRRFFECDLVTQSRSKLLLYIELSCGFSHHSTGWLRDLHDFWLSLLVEGMEIFTLIGWRVKR